MVRRKPDHYLANIINVKNTFKRRILAFLILESSLISVFLFLKINAKKYSNIDYITLGDEDSELIQGYITKVPTVVVEGSHYTTIKEIGDILKLKGKLKC